MILPEEHRNTTARVRVCAILGVSVLLLLLAASGARLPYSYFQFLRLFVCGGSAYATLVAVSHSRRPFAFALGLVALVFNPIIPFHFERETWTLLNLTAAVVLSCEISLQLWAGWGRQVIGSLAAAALRSSSAPKEASTPSLPDETVLLDPNSRFTITITEWLTWRRVLSAATIFAAVVCMLLVTVVATDALFTHRSHRNGMRAPASDGSEVDARMRLQSEIQLWLDNPGRSVDSLSPELRAALRERARERYTLDELDKLIEEQRRLDDEMPTSSPP